MRVSVAAVLCLALGQAAQQAPPPAPPPATTDAVPRVILDKRRFVMGERVFFWTSIEVPSRQPIPRQFWDTGRLIITSPDGKERTERMGWPMDGMGINGPGDLGWRGGGRLPEPHAPGVWLLTYEFAGRRSPTESLSIENIDVLSQIDAVFIATSPLALDSPEAVVTLTVKNRSSETIRFAQPEGSFSYLTVSLTKTSGDKWGASGFVSENVLEAAGIKRARSHPDVFDFNAIKTFPTVTLLPGRTYELRLPVRAVMADMSRPWTNGVPAGDFDVKWSVELQLLIGERDGNWKDFAPIRLPVTTTFKARQGAP